MDHHTVLSDTDMHTDVGPHPRDSVDSPGLFHLSHSRSPNPNPSSIPIRTLILTRTRTRTRTRTPEHNLDPTLKTPLLRAP